MIARGTLERIDGGLLVARLPHVALGASAVLGKSEIAAEVRRVENGHAWLAAHAGADGLACGDPVSVEERAPSLPLGTCALGRAIDARGVPVDGGLPLHGRGVALERDLPMERVAIAAPFWSGIRSVDALITIGVGARVGIFGAPGTGKSTLLELLSDARAADAVVVALVGERGREAQRWVARRGATTTVICATSDRPAAERWQAARVAMAQARALQERGLDVLLLLDSLARTAGALRELAVATGEPPGRGGFPPSVFANLARLVEVAGARVRGSITLVATVLDDGDERDPVSDAARSLLDGHLQLSLALVRAHRFPAIDVPASASRTMAAVAGDDHLAAAACVRRTVAALARSEDARSLGIVPSGAHLDAAVRAEREIEAFLTQETRPCAPEESLAALRHLAATLR